MDKQKLDRWAEKLLDTGKSNNLIKFRDTKASSVEVISPDIVTLFGKIDGTASLEVYDPKLDEDDELRVVLNPDEEGNVQRMDKSSYYTKYSSRLRKVNQILLYNQALTPITALKNIDKKAKTALEETGVNVAYMAFGFINWKESEHSEIVMNAPILLAPIMFERESQIDPYFIKSTEDDILVNPTFSYKLQAEYDIKLPEYNDEGIEAYLAVVEEKVGKLGWTVSRECKIGIFSFLKLNMYRDLKDNQDAILANQNIRRLLGEDYDIPDTSSEEERKVDNPLIDLHSVVDADSSQIEAIEMAKSGKSFVLQGPPGTGKSQTITNIIAESLYDGKRVLFVSEKQAALNVVYDKLKKAGLSDFCLELHSHKANKKAVIEELCHSLRANKQVVSSKAEAEITEKKRRQDQLDQYEEELHKKRDVIGMSLYQMFDAYSECRDVIDVDVPVKDISSKGINHLNAIVDLLDQYSDYTETVGYDFRKNAWYGFVGQDASYQTEVTIKGYLDEIVPALRDLLSIVDDICDKYDITITNIGNLIKTQEFLAVLANSDIITPTLLNRDKAEEYMNQTGTLKEDGLAAVQLRYQLDQEFDQGIYRINATECNARLKRQYTNGLARIFDSGYKQLVKSIRLCRRSGKKVSYKDAIRFMDILEAYSNAYWRFEENAKGIKDAYGSAYAGIDTNWESAFRQVSGIYSASAGGVDFGKIPNMGILEFESCKSDLGNYADQIAIVRGRMEKSFSELIKLFDPAIINFGVMDVSGLESLFSHCRENIGKIENWVSFRRLLDEIKEAGAYDTLIFAISNEVPAKRTSALYKKAFYRQWIENVMQNNPVLSGFSRSAHDQAVASFNQKDEEQFEISKAQIKAELSKKRPNVDFVANGSAVQILFREEGKKRKQKSIRNLLSETAEVVQLIKPCFLMSPLSVSTFLASDAIRFDVVVFDEASQIFPWDAVGAIYRGTQAIIVGDSRQMPPSNFFTHAIDIEDDNEEVGDVSDFESILDICETSMPQLRLRWHYRSHYEQLITFSNKNFYDNDLVTFPSSKTDREGIGVDYYHVDGVFDRKSKTNRSEAERVVDLIFENINKHPERSLGVVAFSVSQADLIDTLLSRRRIENPEYEEFFKGGELEPFFIKNLETVQGDERDTIIFSIAYGRGSDGRLINNFGPLNRVGGERRLNVAVSRAKENIQVVSSMHCTDIDLRDSASAGAKLLREYLDYAENGYIALERTLDVNQYEEFDSEFEMEVCDFLKANGFSVDTQVGCSSFRIDLAIKLPGTSDYVLAVECDGASYHSSKNARDRDRLRQEILENMGWKFYRIWSTDWFRNKQVEKERLLLAASNAINHPNQKTSGMVHNASAVKDEDFVETVAKRKMQFPAYKMVDVSALPQSTCDSNANFQKMIKMVLEVEAPLSEEWIMQRVCYLFGRSKVTSVVRQEFEQKMANCARNGIGRKEGFLYLRDTMFVLRCPADGEEGRDIKYIALEELAAGILFIMKQNIRAERMGLYKSICEHLGYARVGNAMVERLDQALGLLTNRVDVDGETVILKE